MDARACGQCTDERALPGMVVDLSTHVFAVHMDERILADRQESEASEKKLGIGANLQEQQQGQALRCQQDLLAEQTRRTLNDEMLHRMQVHTDLVNLLPHAYGSRGSSGSSRYIAPDSTP